MKVKFVQLILNNYEKKMEDYDIDFFLIKNLENQTKFNLLELNLNKSDSLDKKIESVINYLNENINSQFDIVNNKEIKNENKIPENILANDPVDVDYENICQFSYEEYFIDFLDFNKYLFAFYSFNKIIFISKIKYNEIFKVEQNGIRDIKSCKKINDEKMLVFTDNNIITINIRDNKDYINSDKIENKNLFNLIFDMKIIL